ncbi:MAG: hypothetical protein IIB81_02350 [Nanoarchaeota archaeon]|nr:hypothetical protein [Nanoarchaeota archaeon]
MSLSKEEVGNIKHEAQKTESDIEKTIEKPKSNKKIILISIISIVFVLIIGGIGFSYMNSLKPGPLDDFAQCLTEKGAVMYGATWCKYTQGQKAMFGNSMKFIDYRDFSENPEVKITPTWFIDGQKYENVQSFDKLALVSGCTLS